MPVLYQLMPACVLQDTCEPCIEGLRCSWNDFLEGNVANTHQAAVVIRSTFVNQTEPYTAPGFVSKKSLSGSNVGSLNVYKCMDFPGVVSTFQCSRSSGWIPTPLTLSCQSSTTTLVTKQLALMSTTVTIMITIATRSTWMPTPTSIMMTITPTTTAGAILAECSQASLQGLPQAMSQLNGVYPKGSDMVNGKPVYTKMGASMVLGKCRLSGNAGHDHEQMYLLAVTLLSFFCARWLHQWCSKNAACVEMLGTTTSKCTYRRQ